MLNEKKRLTKLEAIKELEKYDHCLLTKEAVKQLGKPFGFYNVREYTDSRSKFKGLNLGSDHKEGDKVMGLAADTLAIELCKKEGVAYIDMYGRGSALRACCRALRQSLK